MTDLSLFERACEEARKQGWPREQKDRDILEALLELGLITECPLSQTAYCPHCYDLFDVKQSGPGKYFISCSDGKVPMERDLLRKWRPDVPGLIKFLYDGLNLIEKTGRLIEDKLWLLGRMKGKASGFPVWLLIGSDDANIQSLAYSTLVSRSPSECGVILATSRQALSAKWPRHSKTLLLNDLISFRNNQIEIERGELWSKSPVEKRPPGQVGNRQKNYLNPKDVFKDRVAAGTALSTSLPAEAKAIEAHEIKNVGADNARTRGTIENTIRSEYRLWESSGFKMSPR